jgi:hypothetical protein
VNGVLGTALRQQEATAPKETTKKKPSKPNDKEAPIS